MFREIKKSLSLALAALLIASSAFASSHREAPLISMDPAADIADFFVFRSWENSDNVVFVMNVNPIQEPSAGPHFYSFGEDVLYRIHIDNNRNNVAQNIVYEIRFTTEIRTPGAVLPLSYVALPPITALDGPGSEGLILRQRYTVTERRFGQENRNLGAETMFAVPSYVGSRTMPDYEALAAQGIYPLANGGRVFAGQRDDPFYIDSGGLFDSVNLHASPLLSAEDDADDATNRGPDMFSGFNVNTIAIEVPIEEVIGANGDRMIGAYATTQRPRVRIIRNNNNRENGNTFVQVARMGNPLVNMLMIPTSDKDRWNGMIAEEEAQFLNNYCNPALATALNTALETTIPTTNRNDLANRLLRYEDSPIENICNGGAGEERLADFIRLNLDTPPTAPADQRRLGPFAHDAAGAAIPDLAGWPNGRRPNDDVTDIFLRAVSGALIDPATPMIGDGVNFNFEAPGANVTEDGIATTFPFVPTPHSGRDRRHIDPGEIP